MPIENISIGISESEPYNEVMYPMSNGEGASGAAVEVNTDAQDETHGAASTKNYWGEPTVIIPIAEIAEEYKIVALDVLGITADKEVQAEIYKVAYATEALRHGGNSWDEGATLLTVDALFEVGDLVWVTSDYKPNGEVVRVIGVDTNIVTIEREASQFGVPNTGLRWGHTANSAGTEKMYVAKRSSSIGFQFSYRAANRKEYKRINFQRGNPAQANDGVIIRSINVSNNADDVAFECNIIVAD